MMINGENAEELFTTKIIDFGVPITAMHWQDASNQQKVSNDSQHDFLKHVKCMTTLDSAKVKPEVT